MNVLVLVLACTFSVTCPLYEWRFYGGPHSFTAIEHYAPRFGTTPDDPNNTRWRVRDANVYLLDDYNGLKWILSHWIVDSVDFRTYATYAEHYHGGLPKPPAVVEPNEPIVDPNAIVELVGYSLPNSDVVHVYLDCRYIVDKDIETLNLITELIAGKRLCSVCAKREDAE